MDTNELQRYAKEYEIDLTEEQLSQFQIYMTEMLDYNEKVNLTAITQPEEIIEKHFLDSLLPLNAADFLPNAAVIDIGTGAGFPGVPLKIARPDLKITLMDSLEKRLRFLRQVTERFSQDTLIVHGRAEELAQDTAYREQYDVVISRAVAAMPSLAEYCLGFAKVGGIFVAMKGGDFEPELKQAEKAITAMGGTVESVKEYNLPGNGRRSLILIRKTSQTPTKYPRMRVNISKKPLI